MRHDDVCIASVTGDDDLPATLDGGHHLSRSVSQITAIAMPNDTTIAATAPNKIAIPPLATAAGTRRTTPGRRYSGVSSWSTSAPGAGPVL